MANGSLGTAILIIFIFLVLNASLTMLISRDKIRANWNKHKCKPGIIPFASYYGYDPVQTANDCVKEIQFDFMGGFLAPFYSAINYFINGSAVFVNLFEKLKGASNIGSFNLTNIQGKIMERLHSIMTGVNTTFIKINDLFNNTSSMISIIFYMIKTASNTIEASWYDSPGFLLKNGLKFAGGGE